MQEIVIWKQVINYREMKEGLTTLSATFELWKYIFLANKQHRDPNLFSPLFCIDYALICNYLLEISVSILGKTTQDLSAQI